MASSQTKGDHTYDVFPMYVDPSLPDGWSRELRQRKEGKSAGKYDVYIFSPDGKKFRSRTEIERYVEDAGIDVDTQSIDFTVRGKKYTADSKLKPEKKKRKPAVRLTLTDSKSEKKSFPSPKKKLNQLKSSPKKPNKTLSQKLVVKMKFSPPSFKVNKTNSKRKAVTVYEETELNTSTSMEREYSELEDDLVKIKQPPPPPDLETKKQKVRMSKIESDTDPKLKSPPLKKRKISLDKKKEDQIDKQSEQKKSTKKILERRKSSESKLERKKSTDSKLEQRKSSDKYDSSRSKKNDALNELQVLENIRSSSRSERYMKKQEELKEKAGTSKEELMDEYVRDVMGKYEPYEEDDNEDKTESSEFAEDEEGIVSPQVFTGQVKYAYIHSPPMKYSAGSLILSRVDDGWLLEVVLDNTKLDEPVVTTMLTSRSIEKVELADRFSLDIFSQDSGYISVQLKPDAETAIKMLELRAIMDDAVAIGKEEGEECFDDYVVVSESVYGMSVL